MKSIKLLCLLAITLVSFSCDNDDSPNLLAVESISIKNLNAPQQGGRQDPVSGPFVMFDFETGAITTDVNNWDIGFRGTSIIVNGGVSAGTLDEPGRSGQASIYLATGTMASVNKVDASLLKQDSADGYVIATGGSNGWYNYAGPPTHVISPLPGKIIVVKTTKGAYAKLEILSYYKDAPAAPDAFADEEANFTFNYVYQPNVGIDTFE